MTEILRLMDAIATLTGLSFETVCRIGVAKMWTKILDDRITREINLLSSSSQSATCTVREQVLRQYLQRQQYYYKDLYQQQLEQEQEEILHNGIFGDESDDNPEQREAEEQHDHTLDAPQEKQQHQNNNTIADLLSRTTFEGGKVIEPIRGEHKNVFVLDVASLYPTMIINYNISFDTVNCSCCKDDLSARVSKEISSVRDYWICRRVKVYSQN
jgi:hypothetical protein